MQSRVLLPCAGLRGTVLVCAVNVGGGLGGRRNRRRRADAVARRLRRSSLSWTRKTLRSATTRRGSWADKGPEVLPYLVAALGDGVARSAIPRPGPAGPAVRVRRRSRRR